MRVCLYSEARIKSDSRPVQGRPCLWNYFETEFYSDYGRTGYHTSSLPAFRSNMSSGSELCEDAVRLHRPVAMMMLSRTHLGEDTESRPG